MKKKVFLIILTILLTSYTNIEEINICDKNWESTFNNDENYNIFITFKSNGEYSLKLLNKSNNIINEHSLGKWVKTKNTITVTFDADYEMKLKIVKILKNKLVLENEDKEKLIYELKVFNNYIIENENKN